MRKTACFAVLGLMLIPAALRAQGESKEKAAETAAVEWLKLVDAGRYAASWTEASSYFRQNVTQQKWVRMVRGVRGPLGKLVSRHLKTAVYKTSLLGAPDSEYVVMQFNASFAHKKAAIETVTMVFDKDGRWREAGYFIM